MTTRDQIAGLAEAVTPKAVELRRLLHRHPEPAYEEHQTTALLAASLDEHGITYQDRKPKTGLWFDIGDEAKVGFRADLDALPITEPEDNVPRSQNPGWMHACGHDAHAAIAFGVALVLRQLDLPHGIRFLFQPAEESFPGGASEFVEEGLVNGLKGLLAFHVDPALPTGRVGARVGPVTASADKFTIDLTGPGGHTARPHATVDLIADAARVVHELPNHLRRSVDARSPLTMVFGSIHGGSAGNVIPTRVKLRGTVRTLDPNLWEVLPGLVDKALGALLGMSGAEYELDYQAAIPPVVNDGEIVDAATSGLVAVLGDDAISTTEPSMGGEDFANYLTEAPGALLRLGTQTDSVRTSDLHAPSFTLDEGTIGVGIRAGAASVLGMLDRL